MWQVMKNIEFIKQKSAETPPKHEQTLNYYNYRIVVIRSELIYTWVINAVRRGEQEASSQAIQLWELS